MWQFQGQLSPPEQPHERTTGTVSWIQNHTSHDRNVNPGLECIKCKNNSRTRSAYCTTGKHWVHNKCQKMTFQEIVEKELEDENDDNCTCKLCNEHKAIEGEANNTQTVQTSRPTDGHYEKLALPTYSNNALSMYTGRRRCCKGGRGI